MFPERTHFSETVDSLLAYSVASQPPVDAASFRKLAGLSGRLAPLTAACFLLYRPEQGAAHSYKVSPLPRFGVHSFILHTAPTLLGQLNRTTQARRLTLHGRTRGKVDWSATYKARYSEDTNPTVFVCLQSWRRFDLPENQLFAYLLHALQDCLHRVPRWLWDWQAWGATLTEDEEKGMVEPQPLVLGDFFSLLAHRLRMYRGHISLQDISIPAAVTSRHLLAACTSKNELYASLADFYDFYQKVVAHPDWETWSAVLSATLPIPASAAEIGEYLRPQTM